MRDPLKIIGKTIDKYFVSDYLTTGGTAHIYVAQLDAMPVILKLLRHELNKEPDAKQRFHKEVYTLKQFNHPHIIKLLGEGRYRHDPYMVLEYSELGSLQDFISQPDKTLTLGDVAIIIQQLADALHHIHEKNFIHRDVKPSNIMLRDNHNTMLADFGIVRHEDVVDMRFSIQPGTLDFMAPEQIDGLSADFTTDQFALGVLAYLLITGERPFQAENREEATQQRREKIISPHTLNSAIPPALDPILFRAMHHDMDQRYTFIEEFAHQLAQAIHASDSENIPALGKSKKALTITQSIKKHTTIPSHEKKPISDTSKPNLLRIGWISIAILSLLLLGILGYIATDSLNRQPLSTRLSYDVIIDLLNASNDINNFDCDDFRPLYNEVVLQVNLANADYANFTNILNDESATHTIFTTYCMNDLSQEELTTIDVELWSAMRAELEALFTESDY